MNFHKLIQSKKFEVAMIALGMAATLLLVFKAGIFVGYQKARHSYRWGESYHRNFGGPKEGFFGEVRRGFGERDFTNAHGTAGRILKIDGGAVTIEGRDGAEKIILVSDKTLIRRGRENLGANGLKTDYEIVVIGSPDDQGRIEAKLIRVF